MENDNRKVYSEIRDVINDIDLDAKEIRLLLGVWDYDAPYPLYYDVSLHLKGFRDNKRKVYDFLIRIDMLHEISIIDQIK